MVGRKNITEKDWLTFRIGPPLFKYIEILYEKIKKYKKEKERKKDNTVGK